MPDDITKRIANFIEPFRVTPGSRVTLTRDFDPAFKAGIDKKKDGVGLLNDGIQLLSAAVIANALIEIDPQYPKLGDDAIRALQGAKRQLEAEAPDGAAPDPFEVTA